MSENENVINVDSTIPVWDMVINIGEILSKAIHLLTESDDYGEKLIGEGESQCSARAHFAMDIYQFVYELRHVYDVIENSDKEMLGIVETIEIVNEHFINSEFSMLDIELPGYRCLLSEFVCKLIKTSYMLEKSIIQQPIKEVGNESD